MSRTGSSSKATRFLNQRFDQWKGKFFGSKFASCFHTLKSAYKRNLLSSLITTNMGASSSTSKILTPNPAPSQLISKMFQQPNVTQMYANKNIYSSVNGSQIQNLGIDSILHNQVNPHQPNVFTAPNSSNLSNQHQYQHQQQRYQIYSSGAISSHSSSSTVYNQSSGKPNKYAKTYGPRSKTLGGTWKTKYFSCSKANSRTCPSFTSTWCT